MHRAKLNTSQVDSKVSRNGKLQDFKILRAVIGEKKGESTGTVVVKIEKKVCSGKIRNEIGNSAQKKKKN